MPAPNVMTIVRFSSSGEKAMPVGLAFVKEPKRVLIVGLGGGTIPGFLHKHYPETSIDAVDIDPDVVDVAKRFFGFREDATMKAHVTDGRRFIEECKEPYDVIFLDAFGSDSIPYHLATREFLQAVRRATKPDGVVLGNVWSSSINRLYDSMVRTYQATFDELYIFDVRGARLRTIAQSRYPGGEHVVSWDGRDARGEPVAPGIYFARLTSGPTKITRKIQRIR